MIEPDHPPAVEPLQLAGNRFHVHLPSLDYRRLLAGHRHGEVAMVIQREPGWVLLQTKRHYPPGVFRLPTGTIRATETAEAALIRELHEEANLRPGVLRPLLRLDYEVEGGRKDFFTEAFLVSDPRGSLRPNDQSEEINGWREARIDELEGIARDLRRLEPPWRGWGLFRSVLHLAVARRLASEPAAAVAAAEPSAT